MDWFKKIMASLKAVAEGAGAVVDAAVPVAHGDRTKVSALFAALAPVLCKALGPVAPSACPIVESLGAAAAVLVPIFAGAGLVRK